MNNELLLKLLDDIIASLEIESEEKEELWRMFHKLKESL